MNADAGADADADGSTANTDSRVCIARSMPCRFIAVTSVFATTENTDRMFIGYLGAKSE